MSEENKQEQEQRIFLKELCQRLSISEATGRNWLRSGRLVPSGEISQKPFFLERYVCQILNELNQDHSNLLKNRRNKRFVSGNRFYASYLSDSSANLSIVSRLIERVGNKPLEESQLREILAECALQLFCQAADISVGFLDHYLQHYRQGQIELGAYECLIQDLLDSTESSPHKGAHKKHGDVAAQKEWMSGLVFQLEPEQDVLGLLYLSMRNLGSRKAAGAYYTPEKIVKKLIRDLETSWKASANRPCKILDPCCGTGNFLIHLSRHYHMEQLYGKDIDPLAIQIARINLAIYCQDVSVSLIKQHIQVQDYLLGEEQESYDGIVGNPPWGSLFTTDQRKFLAEKFDTGKDADAYDLFLEQSLGNITLGGTISFVLPEAALFVKSHEKIRSLLAKQVQIQRLSFLGNVFDKVQCPAIILQIQKTGSPLNPCGMIISEKQREFQILADRTVQTEAFNFHMTDEEYKIFARIRQREELVYLKGQSQFALGIVTGNNQKYVQKEKSSENEVALKGCDITKYAIQEGRQYLSYTPEYFQQTAPECYYRAKEKLLYRFIGKELVFAYDDRQRLSLNSCNILIPLIQDMDIRYILAVLNSRTAQFVYDRKFRSIKVLRSALEQLPIPVSSVSGQREIVGLAKELLSTSNVQAWKECYDEVDKLVATAYGLTEKEYENICQWHLQ